MAKNTFSSLRNKIDGREGFAGGHQIIDTTTAAPGGHGHGAAQHAARMRRVPVWALDDVKIKQLIKDRYPNFENDSAQMAEAGKTLRLIHLYYRMGVTTDTIAGELELTRGAVEQRVHRLVRFMAGPKKNVGRPKKTPVSIGTSIEDRISL